MIKGAYSIQEERGDGKGVKQDRGRRSEVGGRWLEVKDRWLEIQSLVFFVLAIALNFTFASDSVFQGFLYVQLSPFSLQPSTFHTSSGPESLHRQTLFS